MKAKKITVLIGRTMQSVLDHQADDEVSCDTIKEAKERSRRFLTDDYQVLIEASEPMRYAQVLVDGLVHSEFYRKGYCGNDCDEPMGRKGFSRISTGGGGSAYRKDIGSYELLVTVVDEPTAPTLLGDPCRVSAFDTTGQEITERSAQFDSVSLFLESDY